MPARRVRDSIRERANVRALDLQQDLVGVLADFDRGGLVCVDLVRQLKRQADELLDDVIELAREEA